MIRGELALYERQLERETDESRRRVLWERIKLLHEDLARLTGLTVVVAVSEVQ